MNPVFNSIYQEDLYAFLELRKAASPPGTYKNEVVYMMSLDRFLSISGSDGDFISEEIVRGWLNSLPSDISTATRTLYIWSLRKFLTFRRGMGKNSYIPIYPRTVDEYIPYIYNDEELQRICEVADCWPQSGKRGLPYIHVELPMLLRVLASCGLRLGEALALKVGDVDTVNGLLTIKHAKKDKERLVPLHESLRQILEQYCMVLGISGFPEACLFPRHTFGEHLKNHDVGNRFHNTLLNKAGISSGGSKKNQRGPCLHSLRHYFVLKAFKQIEKKGYHVDDAVPFLSLYLGHESILETQKYMKFTTEMFPDEMERFEHYTADVFPEVDYE